MKNSIRIVILGLMAASALISAARAAETRASVASKNKRPIPETARAEFVKGNATFKAASSDGDYALAVTHYEAAAKIAPWWADVYFNEAKALEAKKDYAGAEQALKHYLNLKPSGPGARKVQDKVYELDALAEKTRNEDAQRQQEAARRQQEEAQRAQAEQQRIAQENANPDMTGKWYGTTSTDYTIALFKNGYSYSGALPATSGTSAGGLGYTMELQDLSVNGRDVRFAIQSIAYNSRGGIGGTMVFHYALHLSADNQRLEGQSWGGWVNGGQNPVSNMTLVRR